MEECEKEFLQSGLIGVMLGGMTAICLFLSLALYCSLWTALGMSLLTLLVIVSFIELLFRLEFK